MTLAEITALISGGGHVEVELHAVDPMIYVAYLVSRDRRQPVTGRERVSLQAEALRSFQPRR